MKYQLLWLLPVLFYGCSRHNQQNAAFILSDYCIVNDSYNEMGLSFNIKDDSVFLLYINVVDSGNYINGYADSNDYAGYFKLSEISDSSVRLKIKNYRYDDAYMVKLTFRNDGQQLIWSIDSGAVAYLPGKAVFKSCL